MCVEARGEILNSAFCLQRHTAPIAGVMTWLLSHATHGHSYYRSTVLCQSSNVFVTSFSHFCGHSWQYIKEPFFNGTMLSQTQKCIRQDCHRTVSEKLLPFSGLSYHQVCNNLSLSVFSSDSKMENQQVWLN